MRKLTDVVVLVVLFLAIAPSLVFSQENITITTYYPSPFGSYRELEVTGNPNNVWTAVGWRMALKLGTAAGRNTIQFVNSGGNTPLHFGLGSTYANTAQVPATHRFMAWFADGLLSTSNATYWLDVMVSLANNPTRYIRLLGTVTIQNRLIVGSTGLDPATNTYAPSAAKSTLDVRGSSNTCIRIGYNTATGLQECPTFYNFSLGSASGTVAPTGWFMCCRSCVDTNLDGICG